MPRPDPMPLELKEPAGRPGTAAAADRWDRGAWLFRDRTLHGLEILLDEAFVVPGTGIRFGLDGIVGRDWAFLLLLAGGLGLVFAVPLALDLAIETASGQVAQPPRRARSIARNGTRNLPSASTHNANTHRRSCNASPKTCS